MAWACECNSYVCYINSVQEHGDECSSADDLMMNITISVFLAVQYFSFEIMFAKHIVQVNGQYNIIECKLGK